ncbi:MAG: RagB/SusD family nutrient uptake outer membrane protein [Bacteroides sp.]
MKKLTYYILLAAAVLNLTACNALLDEDPQYSQNSTIIFSTENNAELALLGCYGYMTTSGAYGQMWQEVPIVASGFCWAQRNAGDGLVSLRATSNENLVSIAWNGMYKVITETNAFLESLEKSSLSDAAKVQMAGEAKFLRGLAYYDLVSVFGAVPLKTIASSSEGISIGRSPETAVLAQVVTDMEAAMLTAEKSKPGRVNSWTAKAFLGKVYYKMACLGIDAGTNWNNAKKMFDEVYESKVYGLPKFGTLFGDYVTGSKEAIIQLNFTTKSTTCFNRASNRFSPTASTKGVCWGSYKASKAAYDLHEGTYPGDPRIAETFLTSWRARKGNNQPNPKPLVGDELCANDSVFSYPYVTYVIKGDFVMKGGVATKDLKSYPAKLPYADLTNPINPSISELADYAKVHGNKSFYNVAVTQAAVKFAKEGGETNWPAFQKLYDQNQEGTAGHKNLMVYRYGEMLLLMADVYNELGNTARAVELANEVLTRARTSGSKAAKQPANWSASLSQEQVREKLFFERMIELCGEPSMYEMPRIRGVKYFKKALELHNTHEFTVAADARYATTTNKFLDRLYNGQEGLTDNFLKKNLLLPIPDSEISANPGITDADQNFGY